MKNRVKRGLLVTLILGTVAITAGCGSSTASTQQPNQPQQSASAQQAPAAQTPSTQAPASQASGAQTAAASGKDIFAKNCASCHGEDGKGGSALALNDKKRDKATVLDFTKKGNMNKGMMGYEGTLSNDELNAVAQFVADLKK
ncbi:c-type cytochrome [Desulfitobacterium sp. Sab5]|uniref:c-type cytochrome n=1 Tax=Desulfitobacterium nosdiversum TaxID=3375356 RepID=UPI003CF651BF